MRVVESKGQGHLLLKHAIDTPNSAESDFLVVLHLAKCTTKLVITEGKKITLLLIFKAIRVVVATVT